MSGLYETTEATMLAAHQAGMKYWQRNKPYHATRENLESLARTCGWHGEDSQSWLAGFYGAKKRDAINHWRERNKEIGNAPQVSFEAASLLQAIEHASTALAHLHNITCEDMWDQKMHDAIADFVLAAASVRNRFDEIE